MSVGQAALEAAVVPLAEIGIERSATLAEAGERAVSVARDSGLVRTSAKA